MISRIASLFLALLSASVLVGWAVAGPVLLGSPWALKPMNPATAVALLLAAASLWLLEPSRRPSDGKRRVGRLLGVAVAAFGATRLIAYAIGSEANIDRVLFSDRLHLGPHAPNRMAPNTALNLLLVGISLAASEWEPRRGRRPAEALTIAVLVLTLLVLVGYSYAEPSLVSVGSASPMSLPTAVGFLVLSVGLLSTRAQGGVAEALRSRGAAGVSARRLLLAVLAVPWVVGWLRIRGEQVGLYESELGTALFTVATILMLAGIAWWTARSLERMEENRRDAERALRESERRTRATLERVEAANAELESFSYSISHDLRAPLRAIEGYGRILLEDHGGELDTEGQRVLGVIRENARQMGKLIDGLLAFSRMGRQQLERIRIDMDELADAVVREIEARRPDRHVEVSIGPLPPAWGDVGMLRQALLHLVDNAWKFTRETEGPSVAIEGALDGSSVIYTVRDNGVGFEMAYAAKLFGMFQRLHRAEEFEGTGVGLAIVERIVKRHGGRIWAEAELGRGAIFRFSLPHEEEGRKTDVEPSGGDSPGRGQPG